MSYAERRNYVKITDPKSLIINSLSFYGRKQELAEAEYHKATLNHDYRGLERTQAEINYYKGIIVGYSGALRLLLAQEAEANGRHISASMSEFDEIIEGYVNGG